MTSEMTCPERSDICAPELGAYDRTIDRLRTFPSERKWPANGPEAVHPYFAALLHVPPVADHVTALGEFFANAATRPSTYSAADREWADLVLAHVLGWNRVFYSHMTDAVAAGVRPLAIKALRDDAIGDLTPDEASLRDYVVAVHDGCVDEDAYRAIQHRFGPRGAVEYTAFIGYLLMNFRVMQAFRVPNRTDREVNERLNRLIAVPPASAM